MTLLKLYEIVLPLSSPFKVINCQKYRVVCNGETVTGVQVDHEKGQIILKTYKRKVKGEANGIHED